MLVIFQCMTKPNNVLACNINLHVTQHRYMTFTFTIIQELAKSRKELCICWENTHNQKNKPVYCNSIEFY